MSFVRADPNPKDNCPTCLESLDANVWAHKQHEYHGHCLVPWLKEHPNCPTCRETVDTTSLIGYNVLIEDDPDIFSKVPEEFKYVILASALIPTYSLIVYGDPSIIAVTVTIGVSLLANAII